MFNERCDQYKDTKLARKKCAKTLYILKSEDLMRIVERSFRNRRMILELSCARERVHLRHEPSRLQNAEVDAIR